MNAQFVFQNAHCKVTQPNPYTLTVKLKGFMKIEHLLDITRFMDTFIKKHTITALLVDQSELKVLSKDVLDQMMKMISAISRDGIQRIAIVDAEDIFAKASFAKINKEADILSDRVTRAHFMHERGAREWLQLNESTSAAH